MSVLSEIEAEAVKIETFISGLWTAIQPVVTAINPTLSSEAQFTVNILNGIALSTSNAASQSGISSAIAAINANPAIAGSVLSKIDLSALSKAIIDVNLVANAASGIESVVKQNSTTQNVTNTVTATIGEETSTPQPASVAHTSGDA